MKTAFSHFVAASTAALLFCLGGVAMAQPAHGPGHGPGPGMGMDIEHVLAGLQAQLNLNPLQQGLWEAAIAGSKSARTSAHANMKTLHDALAAELANASPNLKNVADVADQIQASNQTLRRDVRKQWLALYATFTADQVAVVRTALQQKLARMDSFHAKMLQRMQQPGG